MFCDFIEIEPNIYRCTRCLVSIESFDGNPPVFPCSMSIDPNEIGWVQKLKNFATSLTGHIKNNMKLATDKQIERRLSICQGCEFFKNNTCSKCGCPIYRTKNYFSKLSWESEKCPINKW